MTTAADGIDVRKHHRQLTPDRGIFDHLGHAMPGNVCRQVLDTIEGDSHYQHNQHHDQRNKDRQPKQFATDSGVFRQHA